MTAEFDLGVDTTQIFQLPISVPAREVTTAITPCSIHVHEPFARELRPRVISARHTGATDVHLANCAKGHGLTTPVEQVNACIGDRTADGNDRRRHVGSTPRVHDTTHDRLGRSVFIGDECVRRGRRPGPQGGGAEGFPSDDQMAHTPGQRRSSQCSIHSIQMRRRDLPERVILRRCGSNTERVDLVALRHQDDAMPGHERTKHTGDRGVEPDRSGNGCATAGTHVVRLHGPRQVVGQPAMFDQHTLGRPGGSRGVDHIREAVRTWHTQTSCARQPAQRRRLQIERNHRRRSTRFVRQPGYQR